MLPRGTAAEQRALAAIMFADMAGYRALVQRNERLAPELLEEHRQWLRAQFPAFNGREVQTVGDAFLVEFHSGREAVRPFDELSGDTNPAYPSDGMTEALCAALGNVSALRAPRRSSVMRFKGGRKRRSNWTRNSPTPS